MSAHFSSRFSFGLMAVLGLALTASAAPRRTRAVATTNLVRGYAAQPLATDTLRPQERSFLEKAADACREEGKLAQVALSQAANSEVRAFAQQLAADQRSLGDTVDGLRRKKGALPDVTAPAPDIVSEAYQKLATKTGPDFDREFVRLMAEARTATLALFEQAASETKDVDVRELAADHLPTLRAHQNRLIELRRLLE